VSLVVDLFTVLRPAPGAAVRYHPRVPGGPLKGPTRSAVIQPP
jgi:hypothetical protein